MSEKRCPVMTTSAGAPVADNQNALTAGERGPILLQDYQLIEKLAHQNRERIPERVVHAKGWGRMGRSESRTISLRTPRPPVSSRVRNARSSPGFLRWPASWEPRTPSAMCAGLR